MYVAGMTRRLLNISYSELDTSRYIFCIYALSIVKFVFTIFVKLVLVVIRTNSIIFSRSNIHILASTTLGLTYVYYSLLEVSVLSVSD